MKFASKERLEIHQKTHDKSAKKNKNKKQGTMPDFERPDFSQVM